MTDPQQQGIYWDNPRGDVAPFIPTSARSALDVGCGKGGFGPTLRAALGQDARIVGIESVDEQARIASTGHEFDEVLTGYFPQVLENRNDLFDLISYNDVLEHIVDPWEVLRETRRFLSPSGRVLAAIPNVQYGPVVWGLLKGHWTYTHTGILDRTHVRFFTRESTVDLFETTGYVVESIAGANHVSKEVSWLRVPGRLRPHLGNMQWMHHVVVARPATDR